MFERYALFDTSLIKDRFATANVILGNFKKRYNTQPTQNMPVIVWRDNERRIEFKTWGLVSKNARDQSGVFRYKTYTVAEADVFKKNSTEKIIRSQRCIVPVNGFYVWRKTADNAPPYFAHLPNYAPFGLAGIYSSWATPHGNEQGTFAILTTESGESFAPYSDHTPVILDQSDEAAWLNPALTDMTTVYSLTVPYTGTNLIIDTVSPDIYSKKIDTARLVTAR